MKQERKKKYVSNYNMGLDRFLLNEKLNPNNYFYNFIKNGLGSNKNLKNSSQGSLALIKKSSSQFFGNKNKIIKPNNINFNRQDRANKQNIKNMAYKNSSDKIKNKGRSPFLRLNNNIRSININNYYNNRALNTSNFFYKNNIKAKSVPKDNNLVRNIYNNQNNNNRFINNKRVKTPILTRNEKSDLSKNKDNKKSKNKLNNNYNLNIHENRSFRNYNNIFQPVNIFSQFKRNKAINSEELVNKNSQLFKQFLKEEQKQNNNVNETSNNLKNNNIIIYNRNNLTPNIISNNTNDNTPISSGNLLSNKSNSNQNLNLNNKVNKIIFDKNIDCHEINFHVNGISSSTNLKNNFKPKKKIFKGKKIKCMHDLSKTGLSGDDKKVNQDNYFIFKNFVQGFDNIFMGVCDGHGYYGHEVSGYIKENLPMDLNHLIKMKKLNVLTDDLSPVIKSAFVLENKSLLRNKQIDSDLSGSTCISTIYTPQKLIIANLGDSRCFLGKCKEKEEKDENEKNKKNVRWIAKNLSRDHKPTIPEEAERILKVGGRIRPMKDEDGEFIGPMRVYMKDKDMPGLAMTRSFGDYFGSTAGVISEPEVSEYFFKPEDKFMVLASDGLFEFMESQEIVDIIKDFYEKNDIVGCCEYLYKESTRKWIQEEEDTIDDITMILVFFDDLYEEVDV